MRKTVVKSFVAMTAIAMIASGFSPEEVRAEENLEQENVIIGQSSETDLEKEDPEYGERNDLANSFRYEDGKPIPAESRYTQYSTWPKDIPGTVGYGIDVSKHQGKINWEKVNNSGVDYAIIRCGYGQDQYNQDDEYWDINAKACEQYGIPYGTYLYSYADTVEKAASEAKHVLRLVEGYDLSYPIYYDLEESSVRSKLNKSQIADIAETFCSIIEDAGYEAAIYSSKDWFENYLTDSRFDQWDRWVAQYNTQCTYRGEYTMWQCSSKGYVDGIDGYADLNIDFGAALNYTEEPYLVEENGKIYCYCKGEKLFGEQKVEGCWYYFDEKNNGEMATGWRDIPVKTGGTKTVYYNEDGRMTYGEKRIDGYWYYFHKTTGEMQTGFVDLPNKTVYYNSEGKMLYGEQTIEEHNYYFDTKTGARLEASWLEIENETGEKAKKYFDEEGCRVYGEKRIDGYWYYFDEGKDGEMVTGWCNIPVNAGGTKTVYYSDDGRMTYGEKRIDGYWYYFHKTTGEMQTGFVELPNKTVYYNDEGKMLYGEQTIKGKNYYFDTKTGARMEENWREIENETGEKAKIYFDEEGCQVYGERRIDRYWYYFDEAKNGEMITGWRDIPVKAGGIKTVYYNEKGQMSYGEKRIDGYWYYFNTTTGAKITGWKNISVNSGKTKTVYYNKNGQMVYGEQKIDGYWYYFNKVTGEKITNATVNGHYYDKDGKRTK